MAARCARIGAQAGESGRVGGQAGGQLAAGAVQFAGRQPAGVVLPRGITGAAAGACVLLGADGGQLVLDAGADRRAGVQGLEAAPAGWRTGGQARL